MFVKMLFVANKEILNNQLDDLFQFYPDKHGPYSMIFAKCLEMLKKEELITEKKIKQEFTLAYEYKMSEKGNEVIKDKLRLLNEELLKKLNALKSAFLSQGYNKVLRYIYQKYNVKTCLY